MGATRLSGSVSEPHIIVNSDRTVSVPDELKNIAVQFDHNIETVTFDCPRYWDGHDFSAMRIYINYRCADGKMEPYPCDPPTVDETDESIIHFRWTISRNVTQVKGKISFLVCVKNPDESGNLQNRWSSRLSQDLEILEGIECSSDAIVSENPDIIEYILSKLGGGSDIEDEATSVNGIFVAEYDVTPFTDIKAASDNGKVIVVRNGGRLHLQSFLGNSKATFSGHYAGNLYTVTVDKAANEGGTDTWSSSSATLVATSSRTLSVSDTSTDSQYPSAKAVYTAINDMVSSIDTELLEAIGSGEVTV